MKKWPLPHKFGYALPSAEWVALYGADPDLGDKNSEDLMAALTAEVDALEETLKEKETPEKLVVKKEPKGKENDLKKEKLKVKKEPKEVEFTKPSKEKEVAKEKPPPTS